MADSKTRQQTRVSVEETERVLRELKLAFNVSSYTEVLGRALGLAQLIASEAKDDHTITIERKDGTQLQIVLNA
jgi:redox-regulated HSP33 family molecular chaperone